MLFNIISQIKRNRSFTARISRLCYFLWLCLQWYWIRHDVFDWFIRLIIIKVFSFFMTRDFCLEWLHRLCTHFFINHKKTRERERERMSKQCQKLRSKVKKSFVKLVNIYIYTLYHVAFGHFILSTVLFSFKISKYYWFANAWRYVLCLIFLIQHILTIFFLSEFSFESFAILFVAVFIYRPTDTFHS